MNNYIEGERPRAKDKESIICVLRVLCAREREKEKTFLRKTNQPSVIVKER